MDTGQTDRQGWIQIRQTDRVGYSDRQTDRSDRQGWIQIRQTDRQTDRVGYRTDRQTGLDTDQTDSQGWIQIRQTARVGYRSDRQTDRHILAYIVIHTGIQYNAQIHVIQVSTCEMVM